MTRQAHPRRVDWYRVAACAIVAAAIVAGSIGLGLFVSLALVTLA